jgi:hypothetical protein
MRKTFLQTRPRHLRQRRHQPPLKTTGGGPFEGGPRA